MIDLKKLMEDTDLIRDRMFAMWDQFNQGQMKGADARIHIGFGRAMLDAYKVKIAAMHHFSEPAEPRIVVEEKKKLAAVASHQ